MHIHIQLLDEQMGNSQCILNVPSGNYCRAEEILHYTENKKLVGEGAKYTGNVSIQHVSLLMECDGESRK